MINDFLVLAYSLAVLTYYLGALIYLLPIPLWGVKKWAPTLIYDSFAVTILVVLFTSIVEFISHFGSMFGVSWDTYFNWLLDRTLALSSFISLLIGVSLAVSYAGGKAIVSSFLGPITSIATYTLIVMEFFFILGLVFKEYFAKILALGILLYAIPFRIARSAGASLIALSIVFTIALPFLPSFVATMSMGEENPLENVNFRSAYDMGDLRNKLGVFFAKGKVTDLHGTPIPYVKTEWYINYNGTRKIAVYYTNAEGYYNAGRPTGGLPLKVDELHVVFHYFGTKLGETSISPKDFKYNPYLDPNSDYVYDFTLNNVVYLGNTILLLVGEGCRIDNVKLDQNKVTISLESSFENHVKILYIPEIVDITSIRVNNVDINITGNEYLWNDIKVSTIEFMISKGESEIEIEFSNVNGKNNFKVMLKDEGYFSDVATTLSQGFNVESLGKTIGKVFFQWTILPITYLTILISITYSFAYALGGRKLRIPIRNYV